MLKICLVFWESEPQYAYKRYAYKKKHVWLPPKLNLQILFPSQKLSSPGKKNNQFPPGKSDTKFPFLPKDLGRNDTMQIWYHIIAIFFIHIFELNHDIVFLLIDWLCYL